MSEPEEEIRIPNTKPEETAITFYTDDVTWFMRIIRREGGPIVEFNHEAYPDALPNDFAKAFGTILMQTGWLDKFIDDRMKKLEKVWANRKP